MKQPVEEQIDRTVQILDGKIREIIEKEGRGSTKEAMWAGAFDLLKESIDTHGSYVNEGLKLANKYAPEQLNEQSNEVRKYLLKLCHLTKGENRWKDKEFYQLMLKTVFTPEAYADSDIITQVIDLCINPSPKIRKRAIPVLRRIIEHEDTATQKSATFDKIVSAVEGLSSTNTEYSGKIISILSQLQQEIVKYGATEQMLIISKSIQNASDRMSIPAVTFSEFLLSAAPSKYLNIHAEIAELAGGKGCRDSEELVIFLRYITGIFKHSSAESLRTGNGFILEEEGSPLEQVIGDVIKTEIDRTLPNKIDSSVLAEIHGLVSVLKSRICPGLRRLVVLLAQYTYKENDKRVEKDIEIVIGNIGVDRFMESIKEREFYFWLPMIRASVHSTDIEVFMRRFIPEINYQKKRNDKTVYEALWSCFPSFCRGMRDEGNLFGELVAQLPSHLTNTSVRGNIAQGLAVLTDESYRAMETQPETAVYRMHILKIISSSVDLFETLLYRFKKDQTEKERDAIKSLIKVVDQTWQNKYYTSIIDRAFNLSRGMCTGELKPELTRKETDVPEEERVFIDNAPILETVAPLLIGNTVVTEGILRYILSTHLRTQKMAYKVLYAMIHAGYAPASLIDFFMDLRTDQVLFHCSRHLRLQVFHALVKKCGPVDSSVMCRLVFEIIRAVRTEGGRNRKVAFDAVTEIALNYSADHLNEIGKMAAAGIPNGQVDYQAGGIAVLTSIVYHGKEKISPDVLDMVFDTMEALSTQKKYAVAKASIGLISVLLIELGHFDAYLERALVCLDRIIFHFKMKLHENLKLVLRKIIEKKGAGALSQPQLTLLSHRPVNRQEEKERIVTDSDGKMRIKEQRIVASDGKRKRIKRN